MGWSRRVWGGLVLSLVVAGLPSGAISLAQDIENEQLERAEQLNQRVLELVMEGEYAEAIPLAVEVLKIRQEELDDEHIDIIKSLNTLASLYKAEEREDDANRLFCQAWEIRQDLSEEEQSLVEIPLGETMCEVISEGFRRGGFSSSASDERSSSPVNHLLITETARMNAEMLFDAGVQGHYPTLRYSYLPLLRPIETKPLTLSEHSDFFVYAPEMSAVDAVDFIFWRVKF